MIYAVVPEKKLSSSNFYKEQWLPLLFVPDKYCTLYMVLITHIIISVDFISMTVIPTHKHEDMYMYCRCAIQLLIKFVSDIRQVGGFLPILWFPSPIKLTATIYLKFENEESESNIQLNTIFTENFILSQQCKHEN